MALHADRDQLDRFIAALFRYADQGTFASLRAFDQTDRSVPPALIRAVEINSDLRKLTNAAVRAVDDIGDRHVVFAPPICTFTNPDRARGADLANGLALSVEIDEGDTSAARIKLESLIGAATLVVQSGSEWIDPITGEIHPKRHIHWRLNEPTREQSDHDKLRQARDLAARLVGADPTGKPIVHPLRWAGSWNVKGTPRLARIEMENPDAEIGLDDALERLEQAIEAAGLDQVDMPASGDPEAPVPLVASALATIPNAGTEVHYDTWIRIGYATYRATGGQGYDLWDEWSKKSEKYNAAEQDLAWTRIGKAIVGSTAPRTIGAGTIFFHAAQAGWKFPRVEAPGPPETSNDPGWWHSLEQSIVSYQSDAELPEVDPESGGQPAPDARDGLIINPPVHWITEAPLRQWLIQDWIPIGYVTGLYGDGGIGKSLIAQQLLSSVALGLPWLGLQVRAGRAFGFMCEDDASELHRRQEGINRSYRVDMMNLENLRISARLGFDNLLMTFDQDNRGKPSKIFAEICEYLDTFRPRLVVLDTLADIFGGNEINRAQARQFVQGIGGNIARKYECAVVIPAHPSASGLASGSGTSGSTAWNNTFRARLYITRPEDEGEDDKRLISRMKSNYAPKGGEITAVWENGAFANVAAPRAPPSMPWEHVEAIFQEIDRAWKAGDPWSSEPQTKKYGRFIGLWAVTHLGLKEKIANEHIQKWLTEKYLRRDLMEGKDKKWGLRVAKWLRP